MADDTLCIGDVVCLYSVETKGFVFSAHNSTVHNGVSVGSNQNKDKPDFKDQNVFAFKICAPNRYKWNKEYRNRSSDIEIDPNKPTLPTVLHKRKQAATSETLENAQEQKRQQGNKLFYGKIIQLKHNFTHKFIHVNTAISSSVENKTLAVELLDYDAKTAQFKVMPRYKVKVEGDEVQVGDQVLFESVKLPGEFLHVSRKYLDSMSLGNSHRHELNLSTQQSGFNIVRKYKPSPEHHNTIKVGDIVRFYHKEMEAYIVAEGLFDDFLTEDVHLRVRPVSHSNPKTLFPSSSAITYWQIELQEGGTTGGTLEWHQDCRLLHMCTRMYLCVQQGGQVTLTSDHFDAKTLFRLHPVNGVGNGIPEGGHCRLEHVATGLWLHACPDDYQSKHEQKAGDSKSMDSLKWSKAQLKRISATEEEPEEDAFLTQSVDQSLVQILNVTAGIIPVIQKVVADRKGGVLVTTNTKDIVISALQELADFMIVGGEPIKIRQKLMRNLKIIELIVRLLRCPLNGADHVLMLQIFKAAYDVMYTYLLGGSRKNKLFLAKYIDFFMGQFDIRQERTGISAVRVVTEMIRDKREIVDRITHDHIDRFVDLLKREKNYRYLDLLGVLCVCNGTAIGDNQNYITEVWLLKELNCVFLTDLGQYIDKDDGKMYISPNNGKDYILLQEFVQRNEDNGEYMFLIHQMKLFGQLCYGHNSASIQVLTKQMHYLTWKQAFACIQNVELPDQLRVLYCDLMITMFVDIPDNQSVEDRVKHIYIYNEDNTDGMMRTPSLLNQSSSNLMALNKWASNFLSQHEEMTASLVGNNMLITQVLRILHYLVLFGFYNQQDDIQRLLSQLIRLLDGRNDKPFPTNEDKDGQEMLKVFRESGRFEPSPETKAIVEAKCQAIDVLDLIFNSALSKRHEEFIDLFMSIPNVNTSSQVQAKPGTLSELVPLIEDNFVLKGNLSAANAGVQQLARIFDKTSHLKIFRIVEILMDVSNYKYDRMVGEAMHLLNQYFTAHPSLFDRASRAQVLLNKDSVKLHRYLEGKLPDLRRLATNKLGETEVTQLTSILEDLIRYCHLKGEKEEPHGMNQSILHTHGVADECLAILDQPNETNLQEQNKSLRKVFKKTFTLLRLLAKGNVLVQDHLFERLDRLLSLKRLPQELAQTLTDIFIGNTKACTTIAKHQIEKIMKLVATHKSSVPQFLDLLSAIVKPETLDPPLKRNQDYVMTYFRQFRVEFASAIDLDETAREAVLASSNSKSATFLISMVDLLATCAEGGNRFTTSICQTIFKIPELLNVLNNPNIVDSQKRPFLRFFIWIYLYTPSGQAAIWARNLTHDPNMWAYLAGLSGTLQNISDFCKNNSETVKHLLKRTSPSKTDPSEQMHSSIHYLFDAVAHLVQVFCRSYYKPDKASYPSETTTIKELARSFQGFLEVVSPHVSTQRQLQDLVSCTGHLLSRCDFPEDEMNAFQKQYAQQIVVPAPRSHARQIYEEKYATEEVVNRQLKVFVTNMKMAYEGMNTVHIQTGFSSELPYFKIGRDEELPLGPGFQAHIQSFINPNASSPQAKVEMAEKLVKRLSISTQLTNLSEDDRHVELDIKCLQMLRGIVLYEIVKLPEDFEKCTRLCKKQLNVIKDTQSALNKFGIIAVVFKLLRRANDLVFRESLALLATMLFNGNEEVQTSMAEYFTDRREEMFFLAIQQRMSLSSDAITYRFAQQYLEQNLEPTRPDEHPEKGENLPPAVITPRNNQIVPHHTNDNQNEQRKVPSNTDKPKLEFVDKGHLDLVLRVLGLMSTNQHTGLQELLRVQPKYISSVNLVAAITGFIVILCDNITRDSTQLLTQVFETLSEVTSCNIENQAVVFDNKICDYVNHILRVDVYIDCTVGEIFALKQAVGKLLRCLTEESAQGVAGHKDIPLEVMQCLGVDVLVNTMTGAWQTYNSRKDGTFVPLVQKVGFQFYHLIARRMDLEPEGTTTQDILKSEEARKAFDYYESHTMSIEIAKDEVLQKIHFRVKDKNVLRKDITDRFTDEVDRSSHSNKIQGLVDWSRDITDDIIYRRRISANPIVRLLIKLWAPLNYLVMLITLAVAIVIMVTWRGDDDQPRINAGYRWSGGKIAIYVLGGVHNFLTLAIVMSYVISNRPRLPFLAGVFRLFRLFRTNDSSEELHRQDGSLDVRAYDFKTIYYVIFLGCSIAGTITDGYLFAFHLLHIVELIPHLKRVLRAVTTNAKSLLLVALLGLAIFYIYALILYAFYRDWKWSTKDGRHCTTIYQCYVSILHHGLVAGPYAQFEGNMTDNFEEAIGIMFFDVSFFIIITLIGFYIILGIIVDTFFQLRNMRWRIEEDLQTVCFICGRKSTDFERNGKDFVKHIKEEHNLWAYILFFIHLDEASRKEYSPLELYVFKKLIKDDLGFFPNNRALSLEEADGTQTVEHLRERIDHVLPTVQRLETEMEYLVTRMRDQEADLSRKKTKKRLKTEVKS